jgi:hypothetical protein
MLAVCMTALLATGALAQNATGAANPQVPLGAPLSRPPPVSPLPSAAPVSPLTTPTVQPVAPAPAGTSPLADAAKSETQSAATRRSMRKTQVAASPDGVAPKSATSKKAAAAKKKVRKHKKTASSAAGGADATGSATPAPAGKPAKASKKKPLPNDGSRP